MAASPSNSSAGLSRLFQHYGMLTVFISAISPIPMPMKLFVISSGALGVRPRTWEGVAGIVFALIEGQHFGWIVQRAVFTAGPLQWRVGGPAVSLIAALEGAIKFLDLIRRVNACDYEYREWAAQGLDRIQEKLGEQK